MVATGSSVPWRSGDTHVAFLQPYAAGENPGRKSLASVGSARYISGAQVRGGEPGGADIGRNLPFDESYSLMHVLLSSDRFGLTPRGWCVSFRANMAVCVAPWPPGSVY